MSFAGGLLDIATGRLHRGPAFRFRSAGHGHNFRGEDMVSGKNTSRRNRKAWYSSQACPAEGITADGAEASDS